MPLHHWNDLPDLHPLFAMTQKRKNTAGKSGDILVIKQHVDEEFILRGVFQISRS